MTGSNIKIEQFDLFVNSEGGYNTYRIPVIIITANGTTLAFCEGRKHGADDFGKIDILLRRSTDGGKTWSKFQTVASEKDMTCGNPCPVVDASNGTVWLPFCKNLADGPEEMILRGEAPRTVWITKSTDDGLTWSRPIEITGQTKLPDWTWYATGPCHGIQLRDGRLVIPCDHVVGSTPRYHSHVMLSDDHGKNWRIGGIVDEGTNESAVVETEDGAVYINCRNSGEPPQKRAYAWSHDGGETFCEVARDETLIEPVCQAGLARFTSRTRHGRNRVLFSNPANGVRVNMTVRMSYDECRTWPVAKTLYSGPSSYSDIAIAPDMTICCIYENGEIYPCERLTLARFNVEWLTDGKDMIEE
ncbi:MAG: sialidase family protein [Armatimonadota bacterium]